MVPKCHAGVFMKTDDEEKYGMVPLLCIRNLERDNLPSYMREMKPVFLTALISSLSLGSVVPCHALKVNRLRGSKVSGMTACPQEGRVLHMSTSRPSSDETRAG